MPVLYLCTCIRSLELFSYNMPKQRRCHRSQDCSPETCLRALQEKLLFTEAIQSKVNQASVILFEDVYTHPIHCGTPLDILIQFLSPRELLNFLCSLSRTISPERNSPLLNYARTVDATTCNSWYKTLVS